jgi:hypothetical protein
MHDIAMELILLVAAIVGVVLIDQVEREIERRRR